ncbi:MAG: hypothetical protein H0U75_12255 [Legionella sp.]|nr:hypothetical protein [Legionella sp.]
MSGSKEEKKVEPVVQHKGTPAPEAAPVDPAQPEGKEPDAKLVQNEGKAEEKNDAIAGDKKEEKAGIKNDKDEPKVEPSNDPTPTKKPGYFTVNVDENQAKQDNLMGLAATLQHMVNDMNDALPDMWRPAGTKLLNAFKGIGDKLRSDKPDPEKNESPEANPAKMEEKKPEDGNENKPEPENENKPEPENEIKPGLN